MEKMNENPMGPVLKPVLEIKGLRKTYGKTQALKGVSMAMRPGRVTGILGPNGCGKSTLIKSVLGLVVPEGGEVQLNGAQVLGGFEHRRLIGYMPQNPDFPGNLRVGEILDLLESVRDERASRRVELCELFGLEPHLKKPFSALSGGTKQKVAAVAAFMFDPSVLILDEPTVGLDPISMVKLKGLVSRAAKEGKTVVLVTHMVAEVEQLVDEMVFLLEGEVVFSGTLDEAKARSGAASLDEAIVKLMDDVPSTARRPIQRDSGIAVKAARGARA